MTRWALRNERPYRERYRLARTIPYRRFVTSLAGRHARLGADVVRWSFIVSDFHRLLLAGLPAHCPSYGISA